MPIKRICQHCGKSYQSRPSVNKKFCSMECYNAFRQERLEDDLAQTDMSGNCSHCGKPFRSAKRGQKFCSSECWHAARRNRVAKTCPRCGTRFEVPNSQRNQKYCSHACRRGQKTKSRRRSRPRVTVQCANCNQEIQVQPSRVEQSKSGHIFCSRDCAAHYQVNHRFLNAQCLYCSKYFHRSPSEFARGLNTYCCRECYDKARQDGVAQTRGPGKKRGKYIPCAQCGKEVYKPPSSLKKIKNHFCSRECKKRFRITGTHVPRERMRQKFTSCQSCELNEPDILIIHHKDGNPRNNAEKNLIVLQQFPV
jgi:hypothetical protein